MSLLKYFTDYLKLSNFLIKINNYFVNSEKQNQHILYKMSSPKNHILAQLFLAFSLYILFI